MPTARKSISAAQRRKDPKAGPHGSFPLDPAHLKAAWDLAGHAANPSAVRARIKAYAAKHGLTSHLPKTAQSSMSKGMQISKATTEAMRGILQEAYHSGDGYMRERVVRAAVKQGVPHLLPPDAHTELHALHLPHKHASDDGIVPSFNGEDEGDPGAGGDPDDNADPMLQHHHVVTKAFNPKATTGSIHKSWTDNEDGPVHIEGWMSTPDRDLEKDVTEPEAFKDGPLASYFARSAPLSMDHNTDALPVGHLQKAVIIRNGKVIETAQHPSDPADFTYPLPTSGSGVWVRGVITEDPAKSAVMKGNVAGMSFIGNFTSYEPLPGGGKRYLRIDPLVESTVAAYPVNTKAAFSRVQKALGMDDMEDDLDLVAMLEEAAVRYAAQQAKEEEAAKPANEAVTKAQLGDLLTAFEKRITAAIEEKVQKAQVPVRSEGVGRKEVSPAEQRDNDPAAYLVAKAADPDSMSPADKELAYRLTSALIFAGSPVDED